MISGACGCVRRVDAHQAGDLGMVGAEAQRQRTAHAEPDDHDVRGALRSRW